MKRTALIIFTMVFLPPVNSGTVFEEDFDDGSADGWWLTWLWDVDGSPWDAPGGAYYSSPYSLNYNNGVNYDEGWNWGYARSPTIDISNTNNPVLRFYCNYETETTGTYKDERLLYIFTEGLTLLASYQFATSGVSPVETCSSMGHWHVHEIELNPDWGKVCIEFEFDSFDANFNNYAGWFIDNVMIIDDAIVIESDDDKIVCSGTILYPVYATPILLLLFLSIFFVILKKWLFKQGISKGSPTRR